MSVGFSRINGAKIGFPIQLKETKWSIAKSTMVLSRSNNWQVTDSVEIELREGSEAVLLTVTAENREEFTADGRSDDNAAALMVLQSTAEVRQGKEKNPVKKARSRVKSTADERERATSSPADLKELTAISFLAGAIIDAPGKLIKEFRGYVGKGSKREGDNIMKRIKPFNSIWEQIKAGLRKEKGWHNDQFDYAVEELCKFVIPVNSKLDYLLDSSKKENPEQRKEQLKPEARTKEKLLRWDALVTEALKQVKLQDSSARSASKNKVSKLPERQKKRFERIVFISIPGLFTIAS